VVLEAWAAARQVAWAGQEEPRQRRVEQTKEQIARRGRQAGQRGAARKEEAEASYVRLLLAQGKPAPLIRSCLINKTATYPVLQRFAPLLERVERIGEMVAEGSRWYNEPQPHLLADPGLGDSGAVRVVYTAALCCLQL
jgi:hypothetical protein